MLKYPTISLLATLGLVTGGITTGITLSAAPGVAQSIEAQQEANRLYNQGLQQYNTSQYQAALDSWQAALEKIYQAIGRRGDEGDTLNALGLLFGIAGQVSTAIEHHEQALEIARETDDHARQAKALGYLGNAYLRLGQREQAIDFYKQQLEIAHAMSDLVQEGNALGNLGIAYESWGQYEQAINFYKQQLEIAGVLKDRAGEGDVLGNIGIAYEKWGQYEQAIGFYEQQLEIALELRNRGSEGAALESLAIVHRKLGQYELAIDFYEQTLVISREMEDLAGEGITLHNLGILFQAQSQPEIAIVFYKQSVTIREIIRQELTDPTLLQSYTDTVAGTYRRLADLLLEQGRILEAQQVLELLKVQELRELTDDERAGGTVPEVTLLPQEAAIIAEYTTLIAFGEQLRDCEATRCATLASLRDQRDQQFSQYRDAVASLTTFVQDRLEEGDDPNLLLNPTGFAAKAKEIIDQQPGTVVVYPLVLNDKLWLLWAADGRVISRRELPISRVELGNAVIQFRALIEDRNSDIAEVQALGQELYTWLIAPIEAELATGAINHLVFALDRTTRYLPMGALYDGEQYLIEKYTVATILSAALTDVSQRSPVGTEGVSMLGAGVSQGSGEFRPLPYVPRELDAIIRDTDPTDTEGLYAGKTLLDSDFTYTALRDILSGQQFLHIATHGEFVPGNRDASYLLLGNGEKLPIPDIEILGTYLEDVHLVVLSACQTALGGPNEEGLEIAGLGYYFLNSQVDAVMASLWNVSDGSTSLLMHRFYRNLAAGTSADPVTKAEALQAAQLSFIQNPDTLTDDEERNFGQRQTQVSGDTPLAHPYFWAPFILIGNSL